MAGRSHERISQPDFETLLQALTSSPKGRAFLEELRVRSRPAEVTDLLAALKRIETTIGGVRDQLQPERIAAELRHVGMTLDIAVDGAEIDPEGDEAARRFALVNHARRELATLIATLVGDAPAAAPDEDKPA
jgi:hypothetical protein